MKDMLMKPKVWLIIVALMHLFMGVIGAYIQMGTIENLSIMIYLGIISIHLLYVAFMTFVLIMSSVTMVLAVNAGHQLKKNLTAWWMVATIIGGIIFVGSQAWEWYHFIVSSCDLSLATK